MAKHVYCITLDFTATSINVVYEHTFVIFNVLITLNIESELKGPQMKLKAVLPDFRSVHQPVPFTSLLSALLLWICIFNYQIKQDLQIMKLLILSHQV